MAYSDEVLADSPYFYWRLDETSGTNADDATANNRDGTYTNSPTLDQASLLASYPAGRSVSFGSGNDHVASTFLLNTSSVTVEAWILIDALPAAGKRAPAVGFSEGYGGTSYDKQLFIDENGKPGFYVHDGNAKFTSVPTDALTLGQVYHLVGTADGTTARCYVDGVEVGSVAASASQTNYTVNNIFAPSTPFGDWEKFQGHLDEVAVYTTALSVERVAAHYAAGVAALGGIYKRVHGPAQLPGTATTLYTVPTGRRLRIRHIVLSNPGVSARDVTLSIGTDAAGVRILDGRPLAAGERLELRNRADYTLEAGEVLQGFASAAGEVVAVINGYEEPA